MPLRDSTSLSTKKGWNRISSHYQRRMRIPTDDVYWGEFVAAESKLKILGDVKGKRILEIGCGGAQNSIALSRWGAEVSALDLSKSQIDCGKMLARGEKAEVDLIVGDMKKIPFRSESFHVVMTAISLQYLPDLMATFADVNRVLLNHGNFVFSGMHPLSLGRLCQIPTRTSGFGHGLFQTKNDSLDREASKPLQGTRA
jgi:ubiquinone/menaquinone biosynthesis C-methylase UbiE